MGVGIRSGKVMEFRGIYIQHLIVHSTSGKVENKVDNERVQFSQFHPPKPALLVYVAT